MTRTRRHWLAFALLLLAVPTAGWSQAGTAPAGSGTQADTPRVLSADAPGEMTAAAKRINLLQVTRVGGLHLAKRVPV